MRESDTRHLDKFCGFTLMCAFYRQDNRVVLDTQRQLDLATLLLLWPDNTASMLSNKTLTAAVPVGEAKARLQLRVMEPSEQGQPLTVEAAVAQLRAVRGPDGFDLLEVRGQGCY
jgi:hypothetical protein